MFEIKKKKEFDWKINTQPIAKRASGRVPKRKGKLKISKEERDRHIALCREFGLKPSFAKA